MTDLDSGLSLNKIPALDGLRAIAVFLVIFYHFGFGFVPGGLGVLIFFTISGFLITWLLLKEDEKRGSVSLKRFYARRALRIFPAFYGYAILNLSALIVMSKAIDWPQAIAALLYVSNYYQAIMGDPGTGFSHTWSLAIEEQFYLIWPPLFVILVRKGRSLWAVPAILIFGAWVYRAILQFGFHVWQGYFYEAFDTRFDQLLVGCLLGIVLFKTRTHPGWGFLSRAIWLPFLTGALLLGSVVLEQHNGAGYRDSLGFIFNPLLTAALIPQLIALRGHWFVAWLHLRPVRYLGGISYSLYLYQQLVLHPVRHALSHYSIGVQLAGAIAALILISSASYQFIEKPFLRWKDRAFHA
jgi:peptidoglycan/LPS O-acetylase OafA/YrhL